MITISLCMIVKNEENTIEKCIGSVQSIVDEIIVVDTGSTDRTKEVVSKFTDKIFDFKWNNDFSAARNFSFEQATMDYIMWLDADDVILPADAEKLLKLKQEIPDLFDTIMMRYNTGFDQQGNVTFSYFRERLVKRIRGFKWKEPVHEYLQIGGIIADSDVCVTHAKQLGNETGRNIGIYEDALAGGKQLSPRGMYYYARELKCHKRYSEAIQWFNTFLDSGKGWVEDNINACGELAKCWQAEKKSKEALASLLRSLSFDVPRAEICCQLGYYFMERNNHKPAAFWFELALGLDKPKDNWGFRQNDCWGFIPCIGCAVCYDKLGDIEKAARYNDMALEYKPDSPAVLYNRQYFSDKLSKVTAE